MKSWLIRKDPDAGKDWRQEKGTDRGWDGWMAPPDWGTWVWAHSWSWRWTGKPGVLQCVGLRRVGHDWATKQQQHSNYTFSGKGHINFISKYSRPLRIRATNHSVIAGSRGTEAGRFSPHTAQAQLWEVGVCAETRAGWEVGTRGALECCIEHLGHLIPHTEILLDWHQTLIPHIEIIPFGSKWVSESQCHLSLVARHSQVSGTVMNSSYKWFHCPGLQYPYIIFNLNS